MVCQWCISCSLISWKLQQISNRGVKLAVFPVLHIFSSDLKNNCFVLFCQKIAQNMPWWVLGWFLVLINSMMSISFWNLRYTHMLLIFSAILSVNFFIFTFKTIFLLFFMFFMKGKYKFYKFKTAKQQLNRWMTDDCNITSCRRKSFAYH